MIKKIFVALFVFLVVLLGVANRHGVVLSLDPIDPANPIISLEMPLFLIIFGSVAIGMIMGSVATWLKQGTHRARAQSMERKLRTLEAERNEKTKTPSAKSDLPAFT